MKYISLVLFLFSCSLANAQGLEDGGAELLEEDLSLPNFHFSVEFGSSGYIASFQEVSGLDMESETIEYRHGDSPVFSNIKMPGLRKFGNVMLKKVLFVSDNKFWDWYSKIKMNTIERLTVTIKMLDEEGIPTMTWTLKNAWPTKISGSDLKSDSDEVAIESIELVHEGITIGNQ